MEKSLMDQIRKTKLNTISSKSLLSSKSKAGDIIHFMEHSPPGSWPNDFHTWQCTQEAMVTLFKQKAEKVKEIEYPENRFSGRGIVICGGGPKYFPSLYVNIRMLRLLGCDLPIEVHYIGIHELDFNMIKLLESSENVKCIDDTKYHQEFPIRIHAGWEGKIYSIITSSFEEVLMLDADNTCLTDPTFIFDEKVYQKHGAIFWPDAPNWTPHDRNMWENILGLKYRVEAQIESGQILVNKRKSWKELHIAKIYCDYSDYYFKVFYGDKEAFHFGWRYLDSSSYHLSDCPEWINGSIFVHKAPDKSWLFAHRVQCKFRMDKKHKIAMELPYEDDTLELIDELKIFWDEKIWENNSPSQEELEIIANIQNKKYQYVRVGMYRRDMELLENNKIGLGADRLERKWFVFKINDDIYMSIVGDEGVICLLKKDEDSVFRGRWVKYERCPIEVICYE